jgi:hypothetical protein
MSETQPPTHSTDNLQFTTVEPGTASAAKASQDCLLCGQPIVSEYFAVGDKVLCPACGERANAPPTGSRFGRFIKASLLGLIAGLAGALIWFAIRRVAHLEIGLVAILVGFMVGKAVRKGSGGQGGRGYQILAVVLTYCCICANYMPDVLEAAIAAMRDHEPKAAAGAEDNAKANAELTSDPAEGIQKVELANKRRDEVTLARALLAVVVLLALLFAVSLAAPFLAGASNLIGLLIIGFALWEAWKFNAYRPLPISGPYRLAPPPS